MLHPVYKKLSNCSDLQNTILSNGIEKLCSCKRREDTNTSSRAAADTIDTTLFIGDAPHTVSRVTELWRRIYDLVLNCALQMIRKIVEDVSSFKYNCFSCPSGCQGKDVYK